VKSRVDTNRSASRNAKEQNIEQQNKERQKRAILAKKKE